jgi:histidinol-phosphate aminotransferase
MSSTDPVLSLLRPEILALTPYSSARKEAKAGRVWLDANENPETPFAKQSLFNRYPEPQPAELIARFATYYAVSPENILVTRGSDEGIDLLLRAFCRAGQDAILITPPTYGMYAVSAAIQNARVVTVPLTVEKEFALNAGARRSDGQSLAQVWTSTFILNGEAVLTACQPEVKLVFLCSPNNPTGALLDRATVLRVVRALLGRAVVVVDEAYVEFAGTPSLAAELAANPNLVVLRTLSKAFGLAGIRCGVTLANPALIGVLQKIIAPYPVPSLVGKMASVVLSPEGLAAVRAAVAQLVAERTRITAALAGLSVVKRVWPSDANYLLVEVADAARVMAIARSHGIVWRDRSKDVPNCIRITIGTAEENNATLGVLSRISPTGSERLN